MQVQCTNEYVKYFALFTVQLLI